MRHFLAGLNKSRLWRRTVYTGCRFSNIWYTQNGANYFGQTLIDNEAIAFRLFSFLASSFCPGDFTFFFTLPRSFDRRVGAYVSTIFERAQLDAEFWHIEEHGKDPSQGHWVHLLCTRSVKDVELLRLCKAFDKLLSCSSWCSYVEITRGRSLDDEYFHESVPHEFCPIRYRNFARFGRAFVDARHRYSSRTCKL
jgi:hypothetical protein